MLRIFGLAFAAAFALHGQTAALRGVVTDETGAVIPGVEVTIAGPGGDRSAKTGTNGIYLINGLRPGDYTVEASAPDLILSRPVRVSLGTGTTNLDLQLRLATVQQQITVDGADAATVSTDVSSNASATTLQGKDLDALSEDRKSTRLNSSHT